MVTNVIKGSFPISKVLVVEGNKYVCWKNEDISYVVGKMKILDFYMIAHGKECE